MGKPAIPKGTRDFLPVQMAYRNYIFDTAKAVFQKHGFVQIETPAIENLSTLTGKYGEEGDQLMFKILNRGDKFKKAVEKIVEIQKENIQLDEEVVLGDPSFTENDINPALIKHLARESEFAELALRYDLTVPFARFVVQHQNEITFPFKRFQIQPVWRADRPQKGRYREFFQCDVDIVGTDSLFCEVELIQIFNAVLGQLKVPGFKILMNNRKILSGIAEVAGIGDQIVDMTVAIDKLDKIGVEKVNQEMLEKGIAQTAIDLLQPIIQLQGGFDAKMTQLKSVLASSEIGMKGIEEMTFVYQTALSLNAADAIDFDVTLARGLNYYTGAIFEVKCDGFKGSICGGGRYDGLTDLFGGNGLSGVGISFGADRIYDVLLDNQLFPEKAQDTLDCLFLNFGDQEAVESFKRAAQLRGEGLSVEVYPNSAKMKKQMAYANTRGAKYVAMIGSEELSSGTVALKNMDLGTQESIPSDKLLENIK